jgi:hypothetical protein
MAGSTESGRARTPYKEANTDSPSLRGDDCETIQPTNTKILRSTTFKIDFYLVPIVSMFSASPPLTSPKETLVMLG